MALGNILREARISRGFTESEVAERIKMNAQMVVDLETENYSRIAAPIYGKGYIYDKRNTSRFNENKK